MNEANMRIKMLEAVSELLTPEKKSATETKQVSQEQIKFAKTVLDKVIEDMKVTKEVILETLEAKPSEPVENLPPQKRIPAANEVEIQADNGMIKGIKNAKPDQLISIDKGKGIPWKEAIGKPFTEITLL